MTKSKYIMSKGLAFSEDKDMERLHRLSLKGWHVSRFSFMGYSLEKGESTEYIYSLDYRSLKEGEEEEYLDFFSSSGWSHIASEGNIHLFRAHPGTVPIYSDRDTTVEKYENVTRSMNGFSIPLLALTMIAWIVALISSGAIKSILQITASILSGFSILTVWTIIATYMNKWKVKGNKGSIMLVKVIGFLLLCTSIIIMAFVTDSDSNVRLVASMVIGAIAFPSAIWVFMSVLSKTAQK